ncbi:MAG: antibiotic biosynthesis monooxygenase [Thermoanaerobaculia bacterium]|jgi:quinol monooxygenase YgiN|nr:antibiotic biosynthesis monooxygenase [Thermoanaerobaculia bacterium]
MYFRLVRLKVRPESLWAFRDYYESRILPGLASAGGCLYAALLRPARPAEEGEAACDSLTLWESEERADAYVDSGRYDELLDGADPFLAGATVWGADLTRPEVDGRPPLPDPKVETGSVEALREAEAGSPLPALFLRVVDHRVEAGCLAAFRRRWEEEVAPGLLSTPGCLAATLVEGLRSREHALSVTFWSDEESAVRYEMSGRFDELTGKLAPYLSGLYRWRLALEPDGTARALRGSDLAVSGFRVVVGRKLGALEV